MMNIGLNVGERLIVLSIIPKEGSVVTLKLIRTLISKLGLKPSEMTEFEVQEVGGGGVKWNTQGSAPIDFDFEDAEIELIRKALRKLDTDSKMQIEVLEVYEKFMKSL